MKASLDLDAFFITQEEREMDFFEELQWRGLVKDVTDAEGIQERFKKPVTCYCGIDPTADSLHIGHLQQVLLLRRYQMAGHRVIAVCGGATGMIGDPRPTTERKLLTLEQVAENVRCIKKQVEHFVDFSDPEKGLMVNNHDWFGNMSILEFLRDYGKYFNIANMISKETISKRLESGISFTEFTYTIMQAIDWLHLYRTYNCEVQFGGSDQWGNLVSGSDLIRKVCGEQAKVYGITSPLITKSDGSKFGKSEGGNIWLDPERTSAYEFYQFWVNTADSDIISLLKRLSMRSPEEIMDLEKSLQAEPEKRLAQIALAEELTELVHGHEGVLRAQKITDTLFHGSIKDLSVEEIKEGLKDAKKSQIEDGMILTDVLVAAGIAPSKREARQLIQNGSIQINGDKVTEADFALQKKDALNQEISIIKKGKKNYFVLTF